MCRSRASAPLVGDEIGHRPSRRDPRTPGPSGLVGQTHEAAASKILKRIVAIDRREPRDPLPASGHDDVRAAFHSLEMLAETVVKLPDPDFQLASM